MEKEERIDRENTAQLSTHAAASSTLRFTVFGVGLVELFPNRIDNYLFVHNPNHSYSS
jgi:hypothetical protein